MPDNALKLVAIPAQAPDRRRACLIDRLLPKLFALLVCCVISSSATSGDCESRPIQIAKLEEGQYFSVEVEGTTYGVFKRRLSQSRALHEGSALIEGALGDSNRPPDWWPGASMPPSHSSWASGILRSATSELFVFYALAPARTDQGACHVIHYSRRKRPSFPEPNFYNELGPGWQGGFVDHCTGIAYDYSGRPVYAALKSGHPDLEGLSSFNLIVPEYRLEDSGETLLVCR